MSAPAEVLAAMKEAVCEEVDKLICADLPVVSLASVAPAALAAAEALGWRLVEASEHKRLKERVAQLDEPYVDDRGEHWAAPTAYAYAAVCKALRTCKAERDRAMRYAVTMRGEMPKATP